MGNLNEDSSLMTMKLFIIKDGVIKEHRIIERKTIPRQGELYWDYPTKDVYEITTVMNYDLDTRILLTKVPDSSKYEGMMEHG